MTVAIIIFLVLAAILSIFTLVVVTLDIIAGCKKKKESDNSSEGSEQTSPKTDK